MRTASLTELEWARWGLAVLETWSCVVVLVPTDDGRKVRVRADTGPPAWYQRMLDRRPKRGTHSLHHRVLRGLREVVNRGGTDPRALAWEAVKEIGEHWWEEE